MSTSTLRGTWRPSNQNIVYGTDADVFSGASVEETHASTSGLWQVAEAEPLKPCFCGNRAQVVERAGGWTVNCTWSPLGEALGECSPCQFDGASTVLAATREEAIRLWHERPLEQALEAEIARLTLRVLEYFLEASEERRG